MSPRETAHVFDSQGEELCAILIHPVDAGRTGVVVVVGGPQYRVGSHRQFVLLSRSLAAAGIPVLRFDLQGMGDSSGMPLPFEDTAADISAALDLFQRELPAVERVILLGLCDGASAALIYCHERRDSRISGLALLNPWVRSEASLAATHVKHYYRARLADADFWRKLLSGKVEVLSACAAFLRNALLACRGARAKTGVALGFQDKMAEGWRGFAGSILLVLSGRDFTAMEFLQQTQSSDRWHGLLEHARVVRRDMPDADHTFSSANWRREVETLVLVWIQQFFPEQEIR